MKQITLINPDQITNEIRSKITNVKNRILFLSPSVSSGEEREGRKEDFESLSNQNIGVGGFGKVYKVRHKVSKNIYAIKVIPKAKILESDLIEQIKLEIKIMYSLDHEHIVKLFNHFEDEDNFYLILQFCAKGELYKKLKLMGTIDEKTTAQYIREIMSAVEYLHDQKNPIIHRDIKPENILLDANDKCKLADFGWSNFFNHDRKRMTYCGTPAYLSPEMIRQCGHDKSLDLWNMGVLIFELLTGRPPFEGNNQKDLFYNIEHVKISWPKDFSKLAKDLVSKLLKADPKQRINIYEMKNHPWFKSIPLLRPIYENPQPESPESVEKSSIASTDYQVISKKSITTKIDEKENVGGNFEMKGYDSSIKQSDPKDSTISELNTRIQQLEKDLQKERISNDQHKKEIDKIKKDIETSPKPIISYNSNSESRKLIEELNKYKALNKDRDNLILELEIKTSKLTEMETQLKISKNKIELLESSKVQLQAKCNENNEKIKTLEKKINEGKTQMEEVKKEKENRIMTLEGKLEEYQYKQLEKQAENAEESNNESVYSQLLEGVRNIFSEIKTKICRMIDSSKSDESSLREQYNSNVIKLKELEIKYENDVFDAINKSNKEIEAAKSKINDELSKKIQNKEKEIEDAKKKLNEMDKKFNDQAYNIAEYDNLKSTLALKLKANDDNSLLIRMLTQEKNSLKSKQQELMSKINELEYQLAVKKDEGFKKMNE